MHFPAFMAQKTSTDATKQTRTMEFTEEQQIIFGSLSVSKLIFWVV